jgi:hypothetical protein
VNLAAEEPQAAFGLEDQQRGPLRQGLLRLHGLERRRPDTLGGGARRGGRRRSRGQHRRRQHAPLRSRDHVEYAERCGFRGLRRHPGETDGRGRHQQQVREDFRSDVHGEGDREGAPQFQRASVSSVHRGDVQGLHGERVRVRAAAVQPERHREDVEGRFFGHLAVQVSQSRVASLLLL